MNRLSTEQRKRVVACLVEGNSIRATCRMTGVSKNTVTKLLVDLGTACSVHMDKVMVDLPCDRIQCDEIWSFVGAKQKNVRPEKRNEWGDIWTWVALDADTKLVPTYLVGPRDLQSAHRFIHDVARRLLGRVQLTTDGHHPYLTAVRSAFGSEIDYAMLVKLYARPGGTGHYSPSECIGAIPEPITGDPDPDHISTSYIERQNLTMRMSIRRFTRLTNAHSKKIENHAAAVGLHFAHYNFCRVHASLEGQTPAMAAGVTNHAWTLDELIGLLEAVERVPRKRGPYKPRGKVVHSPANSD